MKHTNFGEPPRYQFRDYAKDVTSNKIANSEDSNSWDFVPIKWEDLARYHSDDVVAHYVYMHKGQSPKRLGKPMDDLEFKRFMGQVL